MEIKCLVLSLIAGFGCGVAYSAEKSVAENPNTEFEQSIKKQLKSDSPVRQMPLHEIAKAPRRETKPVKLPEEGCYVGSGVYDAAGGMLLGGFCFTYWEPGALTPDDVVDMCAKESVGNLLQFWQSNGRLEALAQKAKDRGLYATCIYSQATNGIAKKILNDLGDRWIGYDFGEHFTIACNADYGDRGATLTELATEYANRVHNYVGQLHQNGWGDVMATSSNFALDLEVLAGVEIPCTEDFPFGDLTFSSALNRGLYRQYDLPMWGTHLAHEWYSWLPHRNSHKMDSLATAFRLKYMTGAKVMINESGNWQLQSSLCEDSPMSFMPKPVRKLSTPITDTLRKDVVEPVMPEARKKFPWLDWRSPVATKYRKIIREFYQFCKENPAPKGQPEATWAIAKGNLDLSGDLGYVPSRAVCGAWNLAEKNPNWMSGHPEMSWEVVRRAVMPMPPMFAPNKNIHFSGTPYGLCDIVSFAGDNVSAEYLLRNYKVVMFAGWNTCSTKQYEILCDYVKGGGKLVIGICHLSTDDKRNYTAMKIEDIVNKGDLTALCGFKLKGKTCRKYWATGPSEKPNCLGFVSRRRFGYMELPLGDLEYVAPRENFEVLASDDEDDEPFIIRCKNGKGEVFFMNWWAYPAAANMDVGCSSEIADVGMVGYLYKYCAKLGRGNVWITGSDFENPDENCEWVVCSYFPEAGKICLLNLDYDHERKFVMHWFGEKEFIALKPAEFRLIDAPVLGEDEKRNSR